MSIRYRPEIDGLRTIAVGSVLIYHLDAHLLGHKVLRGGFFGVDIFFVISGFLIAGLIRQEYVRTGKFSILEFYERRARRLLPALFVVIAVTYVAGAFVLMPTAMVDLAKSALASVGFVSNFYWLAESQVYGARSGLLEPLLHTWSLAVEEQFYLVFPLLYLVVISRVRRRAAWLGAASIAGGLVLAEWLTRADFNFSFFMIFSRIWELLCGAVLAHALAVNPARGRGFPFAKAMPLLGLLLIIGTLIVVPLKWHHPGFGTVGAVAGTVLIIWFAAPREPVTRLLSTPLFVGVGLISYSLYLWHYPIYAYGRLAAIMDPGPADFLGWIVLSVAAATATYFLVERPFRDRKRITRSALVGSLAIGLGLVAMTSAVFIERQGVPERLAGLKQIYGPAEPDNAYLRIESWGILNELAEKKGYGRSHAHEPSEFESSQLWFDLDRPAQKVLVVGNSHSKDMFNVLYFAQSELPGFQFARFGMNNKLPPEQVATLLSSPNFNHADTIMLSFRYDRRLPPSLADLLERFAADGKRVVILSNTAEFEDFEVFTLVDDYLLRNRSLDIERINSLGWKSRRLESTHRTNSRLRELAATYGFEFLEKDAFVCDVVEQSCPLLTEDGRKLHYDYGHYTLDGARFYGDRVVEIGWLTPLLRGFETKE